MVRDRKYVSTISLRLRYPTPKIRFVNKRQRRKPTGSLDQVFSLLRSLASKNFVWVVTTAWFSLILVKALVIARGNATTALGLLAGSNFFVAAASAGAVLISAGLLSAFGLSLIAVANPRVFHLTNTQRVYTGAVVLVSGALIFVASPLMLFIGALIAPLLGGLIGSLFGRLTVWILELRYGDSRRTRAVVNNRAQSLGAFLMGYSLVAIIAVVVMSPPWMQIERVRVSGETRVGYVVSQDSRWTLFLEEKSRAPVLLQNDAFQARTICVQRADWKNVPLNLAFAMGMAPSGPTEWCEVTRRLNRN